MSDDVDTAPIEIVDGNEAENGPPRFYLEEARKYIKSLVFRDINYAVFDADGLRLYVDGVAVADFPDGRLGYSGSGPAFSVEVMRRLGVSRRQIDDINEAARSARSILITRQSYELPLVRPFLPSWKWYAL